MSEVVEMAQEPEIEQGQDWQMGVDEFTKNGCTVNSN